MTLLQPTTQMSLQQATQPYLLPLISKRLLEADILEALRISYHMEALIGKVSCLIARSCIYASTFLIRLGYFLDLYNGLFQLRMHSAIEDWMSDIVS